MDSYRNKKVEVRSMIQQFGLSEMEDLAKRRGRVHMPTVGAVLAVLGVPNTFAEEAKAAVDNCQVAVGTANTEMGTLRAADEADAEKTAAAIRALEQERVARAKATVEAVVAQVEIVESQRKEIRRLEKLAKAARKLE